MIKDFASLKQSSSETAQALTAELTKMNENGYEQDDRIWYPSVDASGNGSAVIRFLPAPPGEEVPFVRMWTHGFKGPTGLWYIENSRTTLGRGEQDPVSEYNSQLWNSGIEANKNLVSTQYKRRLNFYSNIYVVNDPANPESNGKVFLFRYGKKIYEKLNLLMNPEFADQQKVNPFDFWSGATFRIRIRKVDGYRNYDSSSFDEPAPLLDDDSQLEAIWKSEYSLQDLVAEDKFKPYSELKAHLYRVLNLDKQSDMPHQPAPEIPSASSSSTPEQLKGMPDGNMFNSNDKTDIPSTAESADEEDPMNWFEGLANKS